ncbi:MAG: transcription-repair coupling factor, partial [Muribaculaceae bacterium]|nr:transcription-repair coupling factor [Muribaculaceae bacterium]
MEPPHNIHLSDFAMKPELKDIQKLFFDDARCQAINRALDRRRKNPVTFYNLAGSAVATMLSGIKRPEPILVVGDSLDDAGYLYHDLSRMLGEQAVLMFPSAYKRSIKYGQIDPPSQILRTEALSRWNDPKVKFVVTYPDALAEQVASRSSLKEHTLELKTGSTVDAIKLQHWLREKGFQEVDYVYEPGQFSVRGSI